MQSALKYIFLLVLLGTSQFCMAQVNLKVGYSIGLTDPKISNEIIERFNETNDFLSDPLEQFNTLSGFELGIRLHNEYAALELSWDNKYNRQYAEGIEPGTNTDFYREIYLRYGSYSLGAETFLGDFGIGSTIDLNRASIRTRHNDKPGKTKVLKGTGWSSHFYLSYNFEAFNNTAFSLKPYIQIPWRGIDLYKLEQELNPEYAATADTSNNAYREKFMNFGLMVIFYNGN